MKPGSTRQAAIAGLAALACTAVAAPHATAASSPPSPVCAATLLTLHTAYGDTVYRFELPQGTISVPAPAPDFDAATAPPGRLQALGLQPSPADAPREHTAAAVTAARNTWVQQTNALPRNTAPKPKAPCTHPGVRHAATKASSVSDSSMGTSPNWSGQLANDNDPAYPNFWFASGRFNLPQFSPVACGSLDTDYSAWVGVGGWGQKTPLMQAGVEASEDVWTAGLVDFTVFWELVNGGSDTGHEVDFPDAIPVKTGQTVQFSVRWVVPGFIIFDQSVNSDTPEAQFRTFQFTPAHGDGSEYQQNTADFIAERPESSGYYYPYMKANPTEFSDAWAARENSGGANGMLGPMEPLYNLDPTALNMTSVDGATTLAVAAGLPDLPDPRQATFSSIWQNCGTREKAPTS